MRTRQRCGGPPCHAERHRLLGGSALLDQASRRVAPNPRTRRLRERQIRDCRYDALADRFAAHETPAPRRSLRVRRAMRRWPRPCVVYSRAPGPVAGRSARLRPTALRASSRSCTISAGLAEQGSVDGAPASSSTARRCGAAASRRTAGAQRTAPGAPKRKKRSRGGYRIRGRRDQDQLRSACQPLVLRQHTSRRRRASGRRSPAQRGRSACRSRGSGSR